MTSTAGYEDLFRAHYGPLVRALTLAARTPDDAADAVQDAFVQLHRRWDTFGDLDEPVAWLRRVAANRVIDQHRKRSRHREAVVKLAAARVPADPTAPGAEIWEEVRALPERQRLAVGLFYLAGLPVNDVADAMNVAPGTVKALLHTARANLRIRMEVTNHE